MLAVGQQSSRDEYVPSPTIESFASYAGDGEFEATGEYFASIATMPVAYGVIGGGCILLYALTFLCRCCCPCLKCGPKPGHETITKSDGSIHYTKDKVLFGAFYFFVFAVIISAHMVFIGNGPIQNGFEDIDKSMEILQVEIFEAMSADAVVMSDEAAAGLLISQTSTCSIPGDDDGFFEPFETAFDGMVTAADSLYDTVEQLPEQMEKSRTQLDGVAQVISFGIFGLYSFFFGIAICYIALEFCESKCLMRLLIIATIVVELVSTIILAILLISVIGLSGWCMDPINILIQMIIGEDADTAYADAIAGNGDGATNDMLLFYLYRSNDGTICKGYDVIGDTLDELNSSIGEASDAFTDVTDNMPDDFNCPDITLMHDHLIATLDSFNDAVANAECEVINRAFTIFVEDGLCKGFVTGTGQVWTAQFFTATWLFMVMVLSGVTYEYFGAIPGGVVPTAEDVESGGLEMSDAVAKAETIDDKDKPME